MREFFESILYQPLYNIFVLLVIATPNHNVGIAIIVLTILIRLALTPVKYRSLESQMKQRELQPEIKRIQEKYKDDRQGQSMAMMQLYKDKNVHPASGCLPMIIQITILFVLFFVFRNGLGPEQYHVLYSFVKPPESINITFLWLKDITQPDPTFIFPILAGVSQFFFSRSLMASMPQTGGQNDMAQIMSKQMIYFAPIMTVIIARSFPAALSLYWVVGTLVDWAQQIQGMKRFKVVADKKVSVSVRSKKKEAS